MGEFLTNNKDTILIIFMVVLALYSILSVVDTIKRAVKHIINAKGFDKISFIFQRHIYIQVIFLCVAIILWGICYIYLFEIE